MKETDRGTGPIPIRESLTGNLTTGGKAYFQAQHSREALSPDFAPKVSVGATYGLNPGVVAIAWFSRKPSHL